MTCPGRSLPIFGWRRLGARHDQMFPVAECALMSAEVGFTWMTLMTLTMPKHGEGSLVTMLNHVWFKEFKL